MLKKHAKGGLIPHLSPDNNVVRHQGNMCNNQLSTNPVDQALVIKGAGLLILLVTTSLLLLIFALKVQIFGLGIFGILYLLVLFISLKNEHEIKIMYLKVPWYKTYTNITFSIVIIFYLIFPFESAFMISVFLQYQIF